MKECLDKKQGTEEDLKLQYVTPAVQAKWGTQPYYDENLNN